MVIFAHDYIYIPSLGIEPNLEIVGQNNHINDTARAKLPPLELHGFWFVLVFHQHSSET